MQLERKREALAAQGVNIASISFDSPELLRHFTQRVGIGYPLLSDPESTIIRAFGILNTAVAADHQFYGIPYPGMYLVGPDGVVRAKYFEERNADRFTPGRVLVRELTAASGAPQSEVETDHLTARLSVSDEVVVGGNRVALVLELELKDKMHVYAPDVEGYIPVAWKMQDSEGLRQFEPELPEAEILHLPAINERVPVYQGRARFVRDVIIGQPKELGDLIDSEGYLRLKGSLRYQACDDKVCYLPQTIELEWKVKLEEHDRTRAPEELRRKR